jgi:hypothetical protein
MSKRTIYFLPRYIGALKYYEKLFPILRLRGLEPTFLLFEDKGMRAYCRERMLPCDTRFVYTGMHIPLLTPILRETRLLSAFGPFLDEAPYAFVTEPGADQRARSLFKQAKERGIPRYALQWALHTDPRTPIRRSLYSRYLALCNRYGSPLKVPVVGAYYLLLRIAFRIADFFRGGDVFTHARHYAEKLGMIDDTMRGYFLWCGWSEDQMRIVGLADYSLMHAKIRALESPTVRETMRARYGLRNAGPVILVLSHPFYTGRNSVYLSETEQQGYFGAIFDDIQRIYSEDAAQILFKLHPREKKEAYGAYGKKGIRVFGNEADLDELVALSDLCIAHPLTAANFTIKASGKPALFVNFSPLEYLDEGKDIYHLRHIYKTRDEFRSALHTFKAGALPLQYDASDVDTDSLEKIADFVTGK